MLRVIVKILDGASIEACRFGLEYTGNYSVQLAEFLFEEGFWLHQINPVELKYSSGIKREKTDKIDAQDIANYLQKNEKSLESNEPLSPILRDLLVVFSERRAVVKQRSSAKNRLSALCQLSDSEIVNDIKIQLKDQIKYLDKQAKSLKKAISKLFKHPELKENATLAQSVPGVGPIVTAYFLITTHNFTRFETAREYASYCGTAPFSYQSGSSIHRGKRVNSFANKVMKALLANSASTVIQHDYEIKQFYERKLEEGKPKLWIMNAIKNKIIGRLFAVLNRKSTYKSVDQFQKWKQAA